MEGEEEQIYSDMKDLELQERQPDSADQEDGDQSQEQHALHGLYVPSLGGSLSARAPPVAAGVGSPAPTPSTGNIADMECDNAIQMPNIYFQARAARDATFNDSACAISGGAILGSAIGGEPARIGSFEKTGYDMGLCFGGTRIKRGPVETKQNGCFSFDPATLTCVCCESSHPVFVEGETVGICVSDQNFPANLSGAGTTKTCVACIRIESASIAELDEIFSEIFTGTAIPRGTTVCVGSASHLHRVGPTIYATDWTVLCQNFAQKFPGVNLCPLVPVLSDEFPGSLAIGIAALTAWFSSIYANGNRGLLPAWAEASRLACEGVFKTDSNPEDKTFVVFAFPEKLQPGAKLIPRRIAIVGSGRVRSPPPDAKANSELVCTLLKILNAEYLIGYTPGIDPVRRAKNTQRAKDIKTAILYGNSNLRQCAPALQALGFTVIDRTSIPWDGSENAAEQIRADAAAHASKPDSAFVFDMLGPVAYRFRQADGSLAMPVKVSGGFHLLGEATMADDGIIKNCVKRLVPTLNTMCAKPTILIPPLPRFVFGGCCRLKNHSVGSGTEAAAKKIVSELAHVRKVAKTELQKTVNGSWWLADPLNALGGEDWQQDLKHVTARDNVHFTGTGYAKIAGEIRNSLEKIRAKDDRVTDRMQTYYWRGFTSTNGAAGSRRSGGGGDGVHLPGGRGGGGRARDPRGRARHPHHHPYARH